MSSKSKKPKVIVRSIKDAKVVEVMKAGFGIILKKLDDWGGKENDRVQAYTSYEATKLVEAITKFMKNDLVFRPFLKGLAEKLAGKGDSSIKIDSIMYILQEAEKLAPKKKKEEIEACIKSVRLLQKPIKSKKIRSQIDEIIITLEDKLALM